MRVCCHFRWLLAAVPVLAIVCLPLAAVAAEEDFPSLARRLQAEKPRFAKRQQSLLLERYDLADRPANGPAMSRGKPVQDGVRGVNVQRLFGSQRAMKTVEDFTEFEQRGAYFDGVPADATRKGTNVLERGSQVHFMAEFQELLDFPPAPKLNLFGKLIPAKATESELRGQGIFFGKGQCGACHVPPYYTDNLMHNLKTERFFKEVTINGRKASADGPIKTFPLRGIKDSPPYVHDDRLLTLADAVEFFNLVLEVKLAEQDKRDLVTFMLAL